MDFGSSVLAGFEGKPELARDMIKALQKYAVPNRIETNWPVYNEAQENEKLLFLDILADLTSQIESVNPNNKGRPRAALNEMVFAVVCKAYEQLSSRRLTSDLEIGRQRGYLSKTPHFNTVLKYFNDPALIVILMELIKLSALPLRDFESVFAVDSSGLSSAFYSRWVDYRFGDMEYKLKQKQKWIKVHLMCGVKTNIVTSIQVSNGTSSDSPQFPKLVRETAKYFKINEVVADKAYSGRENLQAVINANATPYIPFKSNARGKKHGSIVWSQMYYYFKLHQDEFYKHYHLRSNVESTFSMLKRKFNGRLMFKKEVAQVNEALAKVLCHNICILTREFYEGNTNLGFSELAHLIPRLHIKDQKQTNFS